MKHAAPECRRVVERREILGLAQHVQRLVDAAQWECIESCLLIEPSEVYAAPEGAALLLLLDDDDVIAER